MKLIGWKTNVNKRILDSTAITIGEGGFVDDENSAGHSDRRLTSLAVPDSFQVEMDFDWGGGGSAFQFPADENGDTEYDRFVKWYKFEHKRGTCPFWFPCITKHSVNNIKSEDSSDMCLYKITSALSPVKSGYSMRISMTWKEIYSGVINVPFKNSVLNSIIAHNGFAEIFFAPEPTTEPILSNFTIKITSYETGNSVNYSPKSIKGSPQKYTLFFDKISETGNYEIEIIYGDVAAKDTISV